MEVLDAYLLGYLTKDEFNQRKLIGRHVVVDKQAMINLFSFYPKTEFVGEIVGYEAENEHYVVNIVNRDVAEHLQTMCLKRYEFALLFVGRAKEYIKDHSI